MNYLRQEYTARVDRVIDYIEANISQDLSLQELADVAHFSPYHFHRIFRAMVGETLNDFIQRVRIERAASRLVQNPKQTVTQIAFECGFSGSSAFAREFRNAFGMSASSWRTQTQLQCSNNGKIQSKDGQAASNIWQDCSVSLQYTQGINQLWRVDMKTSGIQTEVQVKEMPELHVAYVRHIGPYAGNQ